MVTFDFRTGYNFRFVHPGFTCVGPSLTQQHFKDECDINAIIARHDTTGLWSNSVDLVKARQPLFDDFSVLPDFMDAQNFLNEAGDLFNALPSGIRRRFDNNPAELLEFLGISTSFPSLIEISIDKSCKTINISKNSNI